MSAETTDADGDSEHVRERVENHLDRNPAADSVPAILGVLLLDPAHQPVVEEVLTDRGRGRGFESTDSCEFGDIEAVEADVRDANPTFEAEGSGPPDPERDRKRFGDRLAAADLNPNRFIDVHDGYKKSTDHTQRGPDDPQLSGNYGVYAGRGAGGTDAGDGYLVDVDIDDYDGDTSTSDALDAVLNLPATFTVQSPHTDGETGGHRYYQVTGEVKAAIEEIADGTTNPAPSWGEVRVENQYVVGPGSQLDGDGCSKEWCDRCSDPDGGYYRIAEDREIATITADRLVEVLCADPAYPKEDTDERERTAPEDPAVRDDDGEGGTPDDDTVAARLETAFGNDHDGERIEQVYNGRYRAAGFSDRSSAEYWLANRLDSWIGLGNTATVKRVMDRGNLQKWGERTDRSYRDSILADVGQQDWYYDPESGDDTAGYGGQQYAVETCAPPAIDAEPFDVDERRNELYERYQAWVDDGQPVRVWGDAPGVGKTTTAALAADANDDAQAMAFDKHAKAREHVADDVTPGGYHHLKGGAQPVHDCCMDAEAAAGPGETPECPNHGNPNNWARMCPVYERGKDDDLRARYDALVGAIGPMGAHLALDLFDPDEHPWHGEECRWKAALEALDDRETKDIAGVHEYQTLKTFQEGDAVGERVMMIDEKPREPGRENSLDVEGLSLMGMRLSKLADIHESGDRELAHNLREFGAFVDRVRDALTVDERPPLDDLEPPDLKWEQRREVKDPMSGAYVERPMKDETLAQVKLAYTESTIRRIREGGWNGEPIGFDAVLAAARDAGLPDTPTRRAIAAPNRLDSCPWCGGDLANDNGLRFCPEEGCGWHEGENTVTRSDDDPARAVAWIQGDAPGEVPALGFRALPPVNDLPDRGPLVLDATATPERIAGVYGQPIEDVRVEGTETFDLDGQLHVTQIEDGQYHKATIEKSDTARERIQRTIDMVSTAYDRPLFGVKKKLKSAFEWPENAEVLHYGGARGLNKANCDAVVCIGAPHPDMRDIQRTARLFAQDHPDLDAGGEEYSTRKVAGTGSELAANEPIYRKLRYTDPDGDGRAVPTKAYSGVAGALFRETREKELVQFVHRVRPLLVDDDEPAKDAYLLTNVPTDLPVSEFCSFDELTGDLSTVFPASDGAIRLLDHANDALHGDAPDGFRGEELVDHDDGTLSNTVRGWYRLAKLNGEDVSLRTVRNWVTALEDAGLLTRGEYVQNEGVGYSASRAASKTALTILCNRGSFEAASKSLYRRFRTKVEASDHAAEWIAWCGQHLNIGGDANAGGGRGEVRADGGDPPPE